MRIVFVFTVIAGAVSQAMAVSASINPSADAFVSSANANSNYGGAGALDVSANGLPKGQFQSVMKFDLSSVKTGFDTTLGAGQWQVQSITLQLTAASPNNPIFNASAAGNFGVDWMDNDSWVEGTGSPMTPTTDGITFNTLPSYLSGTDQSEGTFAFAGGTSGSAAYTLGLGSGMVGDVTSGGLASLRLFAADSVVSYLFNSRSFGTASSRPVLTVAAVVPEPVGVAILLLPAALLWRKRR